MAQNVDLRGLPEELRTFNLQSGKSVGRQFQPKVFENLVPEGKHFCVISRNHFTITKSGDVWMFRNLSMNPVKVNNQVNIPKKRESER